jgi:hypothetical protein
VVVKYNAGSLSAPKLDVVSRTASDDCESKNVVHLGYLQPEDNGTIRTLIGRSLLISNYDFHREDRQREDRQIKGGYWTRFTCSSQRQQQRCRDQTTILYCRTF